MSDESSEREELYSIDKYDVILGPITSYYVEDIIAQGVYGRVAKCRQMNTSKKMAIKIVRKDCYKLGIRECEILKEIGKLDPDKNNLLKVIHCFSYERHICMIFDMMEENLLQYITRRKMVPLKINTIRVITQQMLVALNTLKSIGLVHTDLKPDNIMIADHDPHHFKVKLIDFGLARKTPELFKGSKIQPLAYRAPEVILGLPVDESVDMWALGCTLSLLFLGKRFYQADTEYSVIQSCVKMQGIPEKYGLSQGLYTGHFFTMHQANPENVWRLNTPEEYTRKTGIRVEQQCDPYDKIKTFDDLLNLNRKCHNSTEKEDAKAFINLLKGMLQINPGERITPSQALDHPFITMRNLSADNLGSHANSSMAKRSKLTKVSVKHHVASSESVGVGRACSCINKTHAMTSTGSSSGEEPADNKDKQRWKTGNKIIGKTSVVTKRARVEGHSDVVEQKDMNCFSRFCKFFSELFQMRNK